MSYNCKSWSEYDVGKLEMDYLTSEVGFSNFFETKFEF